MLVPGGTLKDMAEALTNEPLPLEAGSDGVIRVRGTRITLDTVWGAFSDGAMAEEIVQQYPSLSLADAYWDGGSDNCAALAGGRKLQQQYRVSGVPGRPSSGPRQDSAPPRRGDDRRSRVSSSRKTSSR
jgi:hypothetical protein